MIHIWIDNFKKEGTERFPRQRMGFKPGINTFTLEINDLKAGIYILKIETADGNFYSQKFIKTE